MKCLLLLIMITAAAVKLLISCSLFAKNYSTLFNKYVYIPIIKHTHTQLFNFMTDLLCVPNL